MFSVTMNISQNLTDAGNGPVLIDKHGIQGKVDTYHMAFDLRLGFRQWSARLLYDDADEPKTYLGIETLQNSCSREVLDLRDCLHLG